jgi:hypothetical protein
MKPLKPPKQKETVTCVTTMDGQEVNRRVEKRRVYVDKHGNRYVESMHRKFPLNAANEYVYGVISIRAENPFRDL